MEQLELFPLSEWTHVEVPRAVSGTWYVQSDSLGSTLSFRNGKRKWVYKLSHVEE